ncbi:MAG: apolipoprotein N-acyltransferase [Acidimicrobiia bacterium]
MNEPHRGPIGPRGAVLVAAASGLVTAFAFPGPDLGALAFISLTPLLFLWRDASPRRAALLGFVAGVAFFGFHLSWTWYFGAVAIVPLVALQAAYWFATGAVVGLLARRGIRSPLVVAAVWVVFEAVRTRWPLGGLAWGQIGAALHDFGFGRALASAGGLPLATFVVVAVNGSLVALATSARGQRTARLRAVAGLAVVVVAVTVATAFRFDPHPSGTLRFALLQGNDQDRYLTQAEIDSGYLTRSHLRLAATLRGRYDLVVFPESSLESDPETDPALHAAITRIARLHHTWILANVIDETTEPGKAFNANRLYDPSGRLVGTYAKRHLVPFGEYVPWRDSLRFISELQQIPHDFSPGHRLGIETVAGRRIGSVICFESAFGPLMRANAAAGAELVVVTTNNRSYRRSANSEQHVALSQMSAAAIGRPVLHASISGITAVIDADGVVHRTTDLFHNTVVQGRVTTTTGETPYVRFGDWVEWGSAAITVGALGWLLLRRRKLPAASETGSEA